MADINSWADLDDVRNNLTTDYDLKVDLDANSTGYTTYAGPSANGGLGWDPILNYSGSFNGDDHTVSDIYIHRDQKMGLFSKVRDGGLVENLGLLDITIISGGGNATRVGALTGDLDDATARNCYVRGGSIEGKELVGGLIGQITRATVEKCFADITVIATNTRCGGFVGDIIAVDVHDTNISDCYAKGSATALGGLGICGGFAGRAQDGPGFFINLDHCYSTGLVSAPNLEGGFLGLKGPTVNIAGCFYDTDTSGQSDTGKGDPKTTAQMKTLATFTAAGWDIVKAADWTSEVWFINEGNDYPRLSYQWVILPSTVDTEQDPVYIVIQLLNTTPYSNITIKAGRDVDETIPTPSWIITETQTLQEVIAQDGPQDRQDHIVQIDCFAGSQAEVKQLVYEADKIILNNRTTPGGKFAMVLPGQWINNDALNQAEGLFRRTNFLTLVRFKTQD